MKIIELRMCLNYDTNVKKMFTHIERCLIQKHISDKMNYLEGNLPGELERRLNRLISRLKKMKYKVVRKKYNQYKEIEE